jgi:outer membrane biogenesis lipoprotein LolB
VRFTEALGLLLPVEDLPVWLRSENTGLKGTPAALIASSDAGLTEALAYVASHLRT